MTKRQQNRKRSKAYPPPSSEKKPAPAQSSATRKRPMRWDLVVLFLVIAIGGSYMAIWLRPGGGVPRYTYDVLTEYPHDPNAFTQGLVFDDGVLWESTGRYGESAIRKTDLKTGDIIKNVRLPDELFGEGLTLWNDQLIQLTWKEETAIVYDRDLNQIGEHRYVGQGWGLTHDGTNLILSDGTSTLRFFDPSTFEEIRRLRIKDGRRNISQLNELEFVNGNIYANQWRTDLIYEIDPASGKVTAIIDLSGLWPTRERPEDGLLNGIAFNPQTKKLMVTGKLCPKIFEVELKLIE
jgi:glutamine cyclotransferase